MHDNFREWLTSTERPSSQGVSVAILLIQKVLCISTAILWQSLAYGRLTIYSNQIYACLLGIFKSGSWVCLTSRSNLVRLRRPWSQQLPYHFRPHLTVLNLILGILDVFLDRVLDMVAIKVKAELRCHLHCKGSEACTKFYLQSITSKRTTGQNANKASLMDETQKVRHIN